MKGYIARDRGIVVLSKGGAFPGTGIWSSRKDLDLRDGRGNEPASNANTFSMGYNWTGSTYGLLEEIQGLLAHVPIGGFAHQWLLREGGMSCFNAGILAPLQIIMANNAFRRYHIVSIGYLGWVFMAKTCVHYTLGPITCMGCSNRIIDFAAGSSHNQRSIKRIAV